MAQGTAKTYGAALAELDAFLGQLSKTASGEQKTSQPVQGADDGTVAATEGARSKENEKDIAAAIPNNINDAAPSSDSAEAKPVALTEAATTGEGKDQIGKPKMTKDDPGTSHPAKAAEYIQGIKEACAKLGAAKMVTDLGNELMADIAVLGDETTKQAAAAGEVDAEALVKEAAEVELSKIVAHLTKEAEADAILLRDFYVGYSEGMKKKAGGEGEAGAASEPIPGEAGGEGAIPPEDIAQLQAAAGEGGAPAGAPMGAEGGAPMGAEGGAPEDAQILEALSQALQEAGITPEELVQAIEQEQQQNPGAPIEEKKAAADIAKLAMFEINRYRNLKSVGRANVKQASIDLAYQMRVAVRKLTGK